MLMMHGRGGCTVRTLVGVRIDNQFSSFLPLRGKINLSRQRLGVAGLLFFFPRPFANSAHYNFFFLSSIDNSTPFGNWHGGLIET